MMRLAINPLRREPLPAAPGLITVLLRSLMANRRDFKRDLHADDLLLVPPLPQDMGFLDWHRHSELFGTAYRWTLEELARHKAAGRPDWPAAAGSDEG